MNIGQKVKIKQFHEQFKLPDQIGEIIAIDGWWVVIKREVAGPQIAPFTVKGDWEIEVI